MRWMRTRDGLRSGAGGEDRKFTEREGPAMGASGMEVEEREGREGADTEVRGLDCGGATSFDACLRRCVRFPLPWTKLGTPVVSCDD